MQAHKPAIDPALLTWYTDVFPTLPQTTQRRFMARVLEAERRQPAKADYYRPQGVLVGVVQSDAAELLISGPAGTGKSLACLVKLHQLAERFPGTRGLILRKFRSDLTESGLVTYESEVLGDGHPLAEGSRRWRQAYEYPNGSILVIGGLDQKSADGSNKVMSADYDVIFVQEAVELTIGDWEKLTTRLRHGITPYQQLIADCNPSAPSHWLKQRCEAGLTDYVESTHKDNPVLWDEGRNDWTEAGRQYIERLSRLTGVRRQRLFAGVWAQAEGVVYDTFGPENITNQEPDPLLPTALAYDDGYHPDPRAILFIQQTKEHILVFDELVHHRHLAETCVNEVVERCQRGWPLNPQAVDDLKAMGRGDDVEYRDDTSYLLGGCPLPEIAIGEPVQEMMNRFRKANIPARSGKHSPITAGIDKVRRHICDDSGQRTLLVHRRCVNLLSELQEGYRYPDRGGKGDTPLDENNHCADSIRYYVWLRGKR